MTKRRVAEPVQVYLTTPDLARLAWLTNALGATKSDVLRRALQALERDLADPEAHPLLRLSGIGVGGEGPATRYDPAVEHDRYLAEANSPAAAPRGRKRRGR
jgi:hypothetical protein